MVIAGISSFPRESSLGLLIELNSIPTAINIQNMTVTYTFRAYSNPELGSVTILEHITE